MNAALLGQTRVNFIGDTHGNIQWTMHVIQRAYEAGVRILYHVGDFGLWPGPRGKKYLIKVNQLLRHFGMKMYIILGNHEDYNRVKFMRTDEDGWLYLKDYENLRFAPRGHVWLHDEVKMAAMGGAASVDRMLRTEGVSWWPEEEITAEDVEAMRVNFAATGWDRVDVMITHDAPAGFHRVGMSPKPNWLTPEREYESWQSRLKLRDAMDIVAPRVVTAGHWHEPHVAKETAVQIGTDLEYSVIDIGLAADGMPRNTIIADLVPGVGLANVITMIFAPEDRWVAVPLPE